MQLRTAIKRTRLKFTHTSDWAHINPLLLYSLADHKITIEWFKDRHKLWSQVRLVDLRHDLRTVYAVLSRRSSCIGWTVFNFAP